MRAEQIKKVVEKNRKRLNINSRVDLTDMIWLVEDLLKEEIEYLEENEPQATTTIEQTKIAKEIVNDLWNKIEDMDTNELVKEHIWN